MMATQQIEKNLQGLLEAWKELRGRELLTKFLVSHPGFSLHYVIVVRSSSSLHRVQPQHSFGLIFHSA
jgi:hypothetical protein